MYIKLEAGRTPFTFGRRKILSYDPGVVGCRELEIKVSSPNNKDVKDVALYGSDPTSNVQSPERRANLRQSSRKLSVTD